MVGRLERRRRRTRRALVEGGKRRGGAPFLVEIPTKSRQNHDKSLVVSPLLVLENLDKSMVWWGCEKLNGYAMIGVWMKWRF